MKKLFRALIPCLLCSAMLAAFAGCGYDVEGLVPHGEKGSMVFLGVNYNESNSLSEGVKVEINFAHETAAQKKYGGHLFCAAGVDFSCGGMFCRRRRRTWSLFRHH